MAQLHVKPLVCAVMFCALVWQAVSTRLTSNVKAKDLLKRHRRQTGLGPKHIECVDMTGQPGEYWHASTGSDAVCGLYVIGDVDQIVQLEFMEFDVSCEDGGLVAVVDGWELQGELFPSPEEFQGGFETQYRTFCGQPPARVYTASQNVALVQFRAPRPGQGFRIRVRFLPNPEPCNVMAPFEVTTFTLKNYGIRKNCTVQVAFPVNVLLLAVDIGASSEVIRNHRQAEGLSINCVGPAGADYAALQFGQGLDTSYFETRMAFCGLRNKAARRAVTLACGNSAVRLQSSGLYYNTITFQVAAPDEAEARAFLESNPQCAMFV